MRVHRSVGYVFIAVFTITVYFMFLRSKGGTDELSPRILLHMSLALILALLLIVKVLVARHQPGSRGLLFALGITILTLSFYLVTMNIASFLLRNAKSEAVSPVTSPKFVLVVSAAIGTLFLRRPSAEVSSVTKDAKGLSLDRLTKVAAAQNRTVISLQSVTSRTSNSRLKDIAFGCLADHVRPDC
jgi:preprotein translocase subunit Sec61beta